jgi:S-adenosylmethionine:tRNA ribosyltransferase-isomerase
MKLSEFYYHLPGELIAQEPLKERDSSRLLVMDRRTGSLTEAKFADIVGFMSPGDCLVINDTKVIPARLRAKRKSGGEVEIFLLDIASDPVSALVNPSARVKEGEEVVLEDGSYAKVMGRASTGRFVLFEKSIEEVLKMGHVPLPPYISRADSPRDMETYQTVYAQKKGAIAAPTAGLHFTDALLEKIALKGIVTAKVTLHTGYGTFAPVKAENVEDHVMHSEYFEINSEAAGIINKARSSGRRVFAVGTTSTRVLETASSSAGTIAAMAGHTNIFIYPGYRFKMVDALITNFHLPGSTLVMLVSAFGGKENIIKGYAKAVGLGFRFYSYGDAMLII